jgi:alkanesulfonate monooxygenase SsuD/methylene tetrahydromethanopterin reductase-like flavin-dependent oxidoreductase (luciferase family)
MKIAYMPDTHGGPYDQPEPSRDASAAFCDQILNEGIEAEKAGFAGLFLPERHHRTETMFPPPLVLLAAYAARTTKVDLGTFVLQTPYYNPMHLAEDVAMIDLMSKGRVILGVGLGYHPDYFRLFAEPYNQRFSRFEESLAILRQAWTSKEPFTFQGKRFHFDNVRLTPKPYQPGGPPLWIGAAYPEAIERAGRLGDGWGILPFWEPEAKLREQADLYRASAAKHGRKPYVILMRDGFVAPTREEAERVFGPLWVEEMLFYYRWKLLTPNDEFRSEADFTVEKLRKYLVMGSPDDCVQQLERWTKAIDADYVIMRFRLPKGPAPERVLDCIRQFGADVIPKFRDR